MYHTIEFHRAVVLDVEVSPKHHLEQLDIRPGTRVTAQLRPYVIETDEGPVEVADVFLADGTTTRKVPFSYFTFRD